MRNLLPSHLALLALASTAPIAFAQSLPPSTPTPATGPTTLLAEPTAVNAHTFRLHMSVTTVPSKTSLFIHTNPPAEPTNAMVVESASTTSAKSLAGTLLIEEKKSTWSLTDNQSHSLIPPTPIATRTLDANGNPLITCTLPTTQQSTFYGSGDVTGTLLQTRGQSRVGNGTTGVPYYWTTAGYSVLALGDNDNAPPTWQRTDNSVSWIVPGNSLDLYLTPAPTLQQATEDAAQLTGTPPVPPRWTFGYMQSRWGWKDKAYIDDTLKEFTDRHLPIDAFIFDFEWYTPQNDYSVPAAGTAGYSDFSFNPLLFPNPDQQIADLHAKGIHVVGIRKPRLGNIDSLNQLRERGWITAAPPPPAGTRAGRGGGRGTEQRLLDYSKPEVRDWYAAQLQPLLKSGIDGWWNDEGEQTYTMYTFWNQSEAAALAQLDPTRRLWTINRAFAPGMQRYGAATWTGDFLNNWQGLAEVPPRLLNWSLAGMDYGASDIGGFQGNIAPELLTRWMQAGVFFPVMRAHSSNNVTPRFPWLYGEPAEAAIRKALELRYRLIPYYYSLAHVAHDRGTPLMRPLAMAFPDDPKTADLTNQWLMGDGLMPAPVLTQNATQRSVYFPAGGAGNWFDFESNKTHQGNQSADIPAPLDQIPLFVHAGTLLPLAPVIQHTDDLPGGPLDLQIYPGANASFTLTEDDGRTTAYTTGTLRRTTFTWNDTTRTLSWTLTGPYKGKDTFQQMKITLFDPAGVVSRDASLAAPGNATFTR